MLLVVAVAQFGYLPLHFAARNNAGLDVVEALLQAHKHAAAVADQVQVGAARDGMHSDLCIRMGHMHMHVHVVFICANICMCVCAFVWSANFFFVPDAGSTALFCACLRVCVL